MNYILIIAAGIIALLIGFVSSLHSDLNEARKNLEIVELANSNLANALEKCEKLRNETATILAARNEAERSLEIQANEALKSVLSAEACNYTAEQLNAPSGAKNGIISDFNNLVNKLDY